MRTEDADARTLAQAMVGRPVSLRSEAMALGLMTEGEAAAEPPAVATDEAGAPAAPAGPPALRIRDAVVTKRGVRTLDHLSLDVYAGEIVGVAGVEGNGQADLVDVLGSLVTLDRGAVEVHGEEIPTGRAGAMNAAGIALIPEDRHASGCVLDLSVAENLWLSRLAAGRALGRVDRGERRRYAEQMIADYGISCAGPDAPFASLSGGNQQRVVLAREMSGRPSVLVAAQPTRGLDVGAIEFMGQRLRAAADDGIAVLLISSELEEILFLADRVVVIHAGSIRGEMPRGDVDIDRIGMLMGGVTA
jgi:simple sugar transport system ATP-binding protein